MAAEADVAEELPGIHIYEGLRLPFYVPATVLDAVKDVQFYPEDILIITLLKSGKIATMHGYVTKNLILV